MQNGTPANKPQLYSRSTVVLNAVASIARSVLIPTANKPLPSLDLGIHFGGCGDVDSLAGSRLGTMASATKRNHFKIGMTNSTTDQSGMRAARSRLRHKTIPIHRNGSPAASSAANSTGDFAGDTPSIQGKGCPKYENTDQLRPKTAPSSKRSRLYFTAKSNAAQMTNG